jgi:RNA polymerase sigma-70 factor (ECF subfamily)
MAITRDDLEKLYASLERPLYNFALRWVWDPQLAEELVQEGFVRVWQWRDQARAETLKSLLFKTIQNLCKNERRKRRLRESLPIFDWFLRPDLHEQFVRDADIRRLYEALERLPVDLRETLLLLQFSEFSYEEAAAILDIPAGTVASRKNRAMQLLKEVIK